MITQHVNSLINEIAEQNLTNVIYKVLKVDETKIIDTKTFFDEFNKAVKPPKKFTNWESFESQLANAESWIPERSVLSYNDSMTFRSRDPEGFQKSKEICSKLKSQYGLMKNIFNSRRDFVFNYNNSHYKQSGMFGASVGAVTGLSAYMAYNIASGEWKIPNVDVTIF